MNLFARIRTWLGHKLLNGQAQVRIPWDQMEMSDLHVSAMECCDASNGRMVIVYDTDHGPCVRKVGMTHEQMLMTLRSSADQIDMATARASTIH